MMMMVLVFVVVVVAVHITFHFYFYNVFGSAGNIICNLFCVLKPQD